MRVSSPVREPTKYGLSRLRAILSGGGDVVPREIDVFAAISTVVVVALAPTGSVAGPQRNRYVREQRQATRAWFNGRT
jgi:hypothetical protein